MVGTLVVILPSSFKGGAIVVEHQGEKVTYRASKQLLSFIAFYADCHHEVRPVKEGYRVVLTYNLMLESDGAAAGTAAAERSPATVDALAGSLREHFETPLAPHRYSLKDAPPREPPNRLVYLLDHQYTERGFGWNRLKGSDAARARFRRPRRSLARLGAGDPGDGVSSTKRSSLPSRRDEELSSLAAPLHGILEGIAVVKASDLLDETLSFLFADDNEPLVSCLVQVLRTAVKTVPPAKRAALGLDAIRRHCVRRLEAWLERPAREKDDWSIVLPPDCSCELCDTLGAFLADPKTRRLEWPINKERRRHIHGRLDSHELPVRHETRRSGSPYTLVLSKTKALFERAAAERRTWQADLKWIARISGGKKA